MCSYPFVLYFSCKISNALEYILLGLICSNALNYGQEGCTNLKIVVTDKKQWRKVSTRSIMFILKSAYKFQANNQ